MKMLKRFLPWNWRSNVPVRREDDLFGFVPVFNRVFDFWSAIGMPHPVSVSETDRDVVIEARLPHMTRKDIALSICDGALAIRAEHCEEREKTRRRSYSYEAAVSLFQQNIPLPNGIDMDRIEARFKRGVLRVILPKTAEARQRARRIPVTVEA
jgi:HSP20 family protein